MGDIVSYTSDTPSIGYDLTAAKNGRGDQTIDNTYDPTTWKIMEVDENGNIMKLFGVPSNSQNKINFYGSTGYNNGVYLLNDICKSRYGNASLGATARSLNIEDIESKMNETGIAARDAYVKTTKYGTTKKYTGSNAQYPAIYSQEKYSGVDVSDVNDGTQVIVGEVDEEAKAKLNPNGKSISENVYIDSTTDTKKMATNLTCTQTFYGFSDIPSSYFDDINFYNTIFRTEVYFWLASRYVTCGSSKASFGLRTAGNKLLGR